MGEKDSTAGDNQRDEGIAEAETVEARTWEGNCGASSMIDDFL
jgi:hypothetical protein